MADNAPSGLDWLTQHFPALQPVFNAVGAGTVLYAAARMIERVFPTADKRLEAAQARRTASAAREVALADENEVLRKELADMTHARNTAEQATLEYQRRTVRAEATVELIRKNAVQDQPKLDTNPTNPQTATSTSADGPDPTDPILNIA